MSETTAKKRAFIGRYLIFPKIQLKYAFIYSCIVTVSLVVFVVGHNSFLSQGETFGLDQAGLDLLKSSLVTFNVLNVVFSFALTFLVTIVVTHRFLGPVIGIRRSLEKYRADKKFRKIEIRKTDEIHMLVEHLNRFLEELDEK